MGMIYLTFILLIEKLTHKDPTMTTINKHETIPVPRELLQDMVDTIQLHQREWNKYMFTDERKAAKIAQHRSNHARGQMNRAVRDLLGYLRYTQEIIPQEISLSDESDIRFDPSDAS